jgi:site-specific recombinase XerD
MSIALQQRQAITHSNSFTHSWLAGQLSGETQRAYTSDIRQFLEFIGTRDLSTVQRTRLHDYRAWLVARYKPATINRKLCSVRQLFTEAVRHGVIASNPSDGLKGHRTEGNFSTTKSPSEAQVRALLDSMQGNELSDMRDLAMIHLMCSLGLRRGEVSRLSVDSIGEDSGKSVLDIHGKGNKRRRVEIPASSLRLINRWTEAAGLHGEAPLFPQIERGRLKAALTPNGVYHVVVTRFRTVGIVGCSPHSLRHFLIGYMIERGCSIYDAQRVAGHSDPRTTERYNPAHSGIVSAAAKVVAF